MNFNYKIIIIGILIFITVESIYSQNYKVIVNVENELSSTTKEDISNYFLKKKTKWNNQLSVIPVNLIPNSNTRILFSEDIHSKSVNQIRAYWQQSIFSGNLAPPIELETDLKIITFVKNNKRAIGYVSSETSTEAVKVLTIIGE